jgi:ATP-dependent protease ClpP protease subunit
MERDYFMSSDEAKAYGLIDEVFTRPKKVEAKATK